MSSGEPDEGKPSRPVRRGVCGKVPNIKRTYGCPGCWQLATFLPYYALILPLLRGEHEPRGKDLLRQQRP